jgi:hypothetical protein
MIVLIYKSNKGTFLSTSNIIREKLVVNNFLWQYLIKKLNPRVCKHSFPQVHEVNIDGKPRNNIPGAVNELAFSARVDNSCDTG